MCVFARMKHCEVQYETCVCVCVCVCLQPGYITDVEDEPVCVCVFAGIKH